MANTEDRNRTRMFMEMLHSSLLLQRALPRVRKVALTETLKRCQSYDVAKQMLVENLAGSPYIPDDKKNELAELVLLEQWEQVRHFLQCQPNSQTSPPAEFEAYRAMVVEVFSRSQKIAALPEARRYQLGSTIHRMNSVDELKEVAMQSLQSSTTLTDGDRNRIANDILDDRYDLLLLPDRFNCDEQPRQYHQGQNGPVVDDEEDACPICLCTNHVDRRLPCGHRLCQGCMDQWALQNGGGEFPCPMCRRPSFCDQAEAI